MRFSVEGFSVKKKEPVAYNITNTKSFGINFLHSRLINIKPPAIKILSAVDIERFSLIPISINQKQQHRYIKNQNVAIKILSVRTPIRTIKYENQINIFSFDERRKDYIITNKTISIGTTDYENFLLNTLTPNEYIKKFNITVQKNNYMEFFIGVKGLFVTEVNNLPPGLYLDNQYIKGTPLISGSFSISICFNTDVVINGNIFIPQLERNL